MPSISSTAGTRASRERPRAAPFGKVQHQVGPVAAQQPAEHRLAFAQQIDLVPQVFQHGGQGLHGFRRVEFLVVVGPLGITAVLGMIFVVGLSADVARRIGGARFRANVKRHSDTHRKPSF